MISVIILSAIIMVPSAWSASDGVGSASDWAGYVNPFIGTVRGSGSTYPGAQVPFGMLSFSPHTEVGNHGSGYHYPCDKINGFGLVHLSGVGCGATCELPFMPVTGSLTVSPVADKNTYSSAYTHEKEKASPGYYAVTLDRYAVNVELSATIRSGIGQFHYTTAEAAHIVFNPTASANGLRDGHITIDPERRTLSGWIKGGGFCHVKTNDYVIYYTVVFDTPFTDCGIWQGDEKQSGATEAKGDNIAAYISFDGTKPQTITMKTAISYVSLANAEENMKTEIPGWDFQAVRTAARADWNKTLGKVQVDGGTQDEKILFYTALYHTLLTPNIFEDVNGQYIGMDNKVYDARRGHHIYSTFSGWDTYRTQAQLWGLLYPQAASDFCQTFLETSRQTQYNGGDGLPLWSMFNDETQIMSGYPAAPFIASAYVFGARDFDVKALTAIMVDSGKQNRFWGRNNNITWSHLEDYKKYGYYPDDCGIAHAISQNVEYAVADFSIAQMCQVAGDDPNYHYFLNRSQSIFNLLNPTEKYLWARLKDGSWKKSFNPYSNDGCQEGTSTHYTWGIPHNLGRLIRDIGGERAAETRLDQLMTKIAFGYDYQNPNYLAGNEPCFGVVPVYNWMGRPWKAQAQMRRVMNTSFANKAEGIPGDDDSGAMSAWYVFAAMGLYPEIPGVGGFAVTGPLFPQITLNLDGGRQIIIHAKNAEQGAPYIQSMSINGVSCSKTWLTVEELTQSPKTALDFIMGSEPKESWGADYRCPSFEPEQ
ncbi:MAG: GH92 family glycosyl hydrolase [Anaerohalosphaeraceae bacterium]